MGMTNKNIIVKKRNSVIHLVLIGTKPDIIKQAPLIRELKKSGEYVLVVHSGQHYSWNLSGGLEEEFGIKPDINLGISGTLFAQQSQIIDRLGTLIADLKKKGNQVIPYIYGDTTTALAAGIAGFSNLVSSAHVEAGLRTMSPSKQLILSLLHKRFNVENYYEDLQESSDWYKGSYEPYPEQFDTRAAAPSAGVHFAPVRLNADHLISEGYSKERVFIVGNPVVDAIEIAKKNLKRSTIFDTYPILSHGNIIRFCIHRRENISSFHRFSALYEAMITLVKEGRTVLFISLGATEKALEAYNLKKETIVLSKKYPNFIYSPVWPYYYDVIAAMQKCSVVATDSGSIQEETVTLRLPGVVLRFNSDRPESIFQGSNIIAPPISADIVAKIVREVADNKNLAKKMKSGAKLYGQNVSQKMVKIVKSAIKSESLFNLFDLMEHDRLGLKNHIQWKKGSTTW